MSEHPAIGRRITLTDRIDPARAVALHATLGRSGPPPGAGDPLPAFWHWIQFWQALPPGELGRDGHPRTGGFLPDTGLPRRMWAGGRLKFHRPLIIGETATKTSTITGVTRKAGRSGPLTFVAVTHEITGPSGPAVTEVQELVFREDPKPDAPAPVLRQAPRNETHRETRGFDSTTLFRYSALTFNGHRIHYDPDYCREVEGYPGLVVHGPLLAQLMAGMAEARLPRLRQFTFRAVAPVFDFETADVCARETGEALELWVRAGDGRLAMTGSAR